MAEMLRVLIVEDYPPDAGLAEREVRKVLPDSEFVCVETREDFLAALESFTPDLILSDYKLPHFDGLSALKLAQEHVPEVPFIIITGSLNESIAVECMKAGAWDYVIKEHVKRLGPAVLSCLEQKRLRIERKRSEEALRANEEKYRLHFENVSDVLFSYDREFRILSVSPSLEQVLGYKPEEFIGKPVPELNILSPEDIEKAFSNAMRVFGGERVRTIVYKFIARDGTRKYGEVSSTPLLCDGQVVAVFSVARDITERKLVEELLTKAKEEWERTFDAIADPLMILDARHRVLRANKAMADKLGVTTSEAQGLTCYKHVHGTTGPPEFCPHALLLSDGKSHSVEIHEERLGGYYQVSVAPLYGPDGKLYGSVHIAHDITEHLKMEESLRESEARHRTILETVQAGMVIIDLDTHTIVDINPAAAKMIGKTREQVIGLACHRHICPAEQGKCPITDLKKPMDNSERVLLKADGTSIPIIKSVTPITLGGRRCLIETFVDITERKQDEDERKRLAHKISLILDSAGEGIYGVDMVGKVTFINPAATRMLGYEVEELFGRQSHATWHHHNPDGTVLSVEQCRLANVLKEGIASANENSFFWKRDGKYFPVEYTSTPMIEADKLVGAVVVFRDMTRHMLEEQERIKLEGQLRHAQKMEAIGMLAGGIAHDFNNILNVIIGYGIMMLGRLENDPLSKEQLNEVLAAADRAATLTKRLLLFSRKQGVVMKLLNVNEIILGMEKMLCRIIREDINFTLELTSGKMMVMGDSGNIEQVLLNLVSNACQAMPQGGRLTISSGIKEVDDAFIAASGYGKAGTYALISVTDTGIGMDAETQKKIFEPFFTTKGIGEGTGLGLSIAYGIIKQHNGNINVYSEEGKGATFKILLPIIEGAATQGQAVEAVATIKGGTETILIAEDDAALRKMSRIVLESFGYSVITAEDGADAITKYQENEDKIQLVILDLIMPKINGKEAYEEIKKIRPDIKTLFASGYAMDILAKENLCDERMDFILKPLSPRDLLKKVREMLDR